MSDHLFRRNLLALSASSAAAATRLDAAEPDPRLRLRAAKSGAVVPVKQLGEREAAFHSLVDPEREGERLAQAQPPGGFVVALGLGGGYGLRPRLASAATSGLVIVEYDAALLRALLEEIDVSDIFLDGRVSLILDPEPGELEAQLLATYLPSVFGDLRVLPLRGRTDLDPEAFGGAADAVRAVLDRISDDYSVQAFFGKRWFRNAVRNIFRAEHPSPPLRPARRAVVTAAGPSLEEGMGAVREAVREGAVLIATDTSLPALLGCALKPDAVVSIDCQPISYYHFLKGIPSSTPLILDLASPDLLARLSGNLRFFSSGHPLCAYLSSRWRPFPALDTSGGNVTHAALSLAEALGADRALLVGADFSYPEGKSYARGTYIYDYFDARSGRLSPVESLFQGFIFRNASVTRERDLDAAGKSYDRYVTKPLLSYREHLERFAAASPLDIEPLRGKGVEIRVPRDRPARSRRDRPLFAAGPAQGSAEAFLRGYVRALRALPAPTEPAAAWLRALKPEERDLMTTLLPASGALRRNDERQRQAELGEGGGTGPGSRPLEPAELLEKTRKWSIETVEETLDAECR
jgi:hypothetical protein